MHRKLIALAVVPLILIAGMGILWSNGAPGADGLPDISGSWVGKAKVKGYDMTGDDEDDRQTVPISVHVTQTGPDLTLVITPPDGDPITMEGLIGDGHLWVATSGLDDPAFMLAHVKKKGKQIKGIVLSGNHDWADEVKISLKRPK